MYGQVGDASFLLFPAPPSPSSSSFHGIAGDAPHSWGPGEAALPEVFVKYQTANP